MRSVVRPMPAFAVLLVPLAVLALLGSIELSRQAERADTYLRGRAADFVAHAVRDFESDLHRHCAALFGELATAADDPIAAALTMRSTQPDLLDILVVSGDGEIAHPRVGPLTGAPLWTVSNRELRTAQALAIAGDTAGATALLTEVAQRAASPEEARSEARNRSAIELGLQAELQLAGLERAAGNLAGARDRLRHAQERLATLASERDHSTRRRTWQRRLRERSDLAALALLARVGCAELDRDLDGNGGQLLPIANDLIKSDYDEVADGLLVAIFDRVAAGLTAADTAAALQEARRRLWHHLEGRRLARDCDDQIGDALRRRTAAAKAGELICLPFDTGTTACLAVLRAGDADRGVLRRGQWAGALLDLTGYIQHTVFSRPGEESASFQLEVLDASGRPVLRQRKPVEQSPWPADVLSRSALVGLQFGAVPRNADELLSNRRASTRNRALLILALCLTMLGGAVFLVRTVARESELAAMKVGLVSRVSHELKTPLSMIKMYGETLAMGRSQSPEQTQRFGSIVSREADRLTNLIERILDFSRRQGENPVYHRAPAELHTQVRELTTEYRSHVESAGAQLLVTIAAEVRVEIDAAAFASALINLLENAVKYTPTATDDRTIEVVLRRDATHAVIEVMDRGIGVPEAERSRIFTSFYRASNAGAIRGAGLGLSLVQHFATAHGGSATALPRPGGGTIFRLALPLVDASPPTP